MTSLNYKNKKNMDSTTIHLKLAPFLPYKMTTKLKSFSYLYIQYQGPKKPREINKIITYPFPLFLEHVNARTNSIPKKIQILKQVGYTYITYLN